MDPVSPRDASGDRATAEFTAQHRAAFPLRRQSPENGSYWEKIAESFLRSHGLKCQIRNFNCRHGEIDLISINGDSVVFVEVRYRSGQSFGGSLASITKAKQQRLVKAAALFLAMNTHVSQHRCRFDVIAIRGNRSRPVIQWLKNAFNLE